MTTPPLRFFQPSISGHNCFPSTNFINGAKVTLTAQTLHLFSQLLLHIAAPFVSGVLRHMSNSTSSELCLFLEGSRATPSPSPKCGSIFIHMCPVEYLSICVGFCIRNASQSLFFFLPQAFPQLPHRVPSHGEVIS